MSAGKAKPALTYTVTGMVNNETAASAISAPPSVTSPSAVMSIAGSYPIVVTGGTASANYTIANRTGGTLTVTPGNVVAPDTSLSALSLSAGNLSPAGAGSPSAQNGPGSPSLRTSNGDFNEIWRTPSALSGRRTGGLPCRSEASSDQ